MVDAQVSFAEGELATKSRQKLSCEARLCRGVGMVDKPVSKTGG